MFISTEFATITVLVKKIMNIYWIEDNNLFMLKNAENKTRHAYF